MHTINWYPGHMAKARRMLEDNIRLVDMVIEIVDARAPMACRNPDFESLFKNKLRVIVLNKSDLSSKAQNRAWIEYFKKQGITALELVSTSPSMRKNAVAMIERTGKAAMEKAAAKGIHKTLRAMIVGIPNAGKSTFINRIAGAARAQVGDRPGVTKSKQWVKVSDYLELLDTPGLLWGKLDNELLAKHLAYIGSIKDDVLDIEEIASLLLYDLMRICPDQLIARYKKLTSDIETPAEMLDGVCRSRGFILSGGVYDTERAARIVLDEYRAGKIAAIALENPDDDFNAPADETKKENTDTENE
ncbi:MAG: ribosome biogenesis GTPase YlqF [Clostridia bacterium]|nr:ribosome biogenesis GTPase YlqF [Clostridia bacterium]MBQ3938930.1 ribosome biogenesis GTPase YlqF [Clostridia bacterium]